MATRILFLLLIFASSAFSSAAKSRVSGNITLGSTLSTNTNSNFWPSPSRRFAFGFYPELEGFKVGIWILGIQNITVVWTASRNDMPVSNGARLALTEEGIILRTQSGNITVSDSSNGSISSASMLNSGNFVLYNSDSEIIWESFDYPTDTILAGQRLVGGSQLYSGVNKNNHSTGRFRLNMQIDGNLVLYPVSADDDFLDAYWATETYWQGKGVTLKLDEYGHLYLFNATGFNILNLTQGSFSVNTSLIYRATLDEDGIFRLYSHSFGRNGSSNTSAISISNSDTCEVKGYCGINSYCSRLDTEPTCLCLPGFDYVNPKRNFEGCERNSTESDCRGNMNYSTVENTRWGDAPYSILSDVAEEECKLACSDECICMVANYKERECSKHRLPLSFGRIDMSDSVRTFVKMGNSNPTQILDGKSYRLLFMVCMVVMSFLFVTVALSALQITVNRIRIGRYRDFVGYKIIDGVNLRSFKYRELHGATNGFREELGRGAFGAVFGGNLFGNVKIAVKKLDKLMAEGERQFLTEMNIIAKTHHRNLIRLLGYCDEGSSRLLVYEFMCNGSLADILFNGERMLNWEDRVRISSEIAMGLLYLHEECDTQIIHCDIKPQNILLNESWTAKISDFGLAKLLNTDQTRTLTDARGTRGYVAPEWNRRIPINAKVDVYSFGVMLLEIICCRKSLKADVPENEILLSDWVYECFARGKLPKLIAPEELESREEMRRLERMVLVGLWCIQEVPSLRPSMKRVVLMLEGMVGIQAPPFPLAPILAANLTHSPGNSGMACERR